MNIRDFAPDGYIFPCETVDPEIFSPAQETVGRGGKDTEATAQARAFCAECMVREACLDEALDMAKAGVQVVGIWGGTTTKERKSKLREEQRSVA